jgi:hypothetical protein
MYGFGMVFFSLGTAVILFFGVCVRKIQKYQPTLQKLKKTLEKSLSRLTLLYNLIIILYYLKVFNLN